MHTTAPATQPQDVAVSVRWLNPIVVAPCQASLQVVEHLANRFSIIVGRNK